MTMINKILVAVLVVQVALIVVLRSGSGGKGVPDLVPVLAGFDADAVERIRLSASDDATSIELVRSGGDWQLASHFDYPVNAVSAIELLGKLASTKSRGILTNNVARQKQLGVADDGYERKIEIDAGGKTTVLYLGNTAGTRKAAVRVGGSDAIYAASGISAGAIRPDPAAWITTQYFKLEQGSVTSMDIANANGTFSFVRKGDAWERVGEITPDGKQIATSTINGALAKAAAITMVAPADPGATVPTVVTVTLRKGGPVDKEVEDGASEPMSVPAEEYVLQIAAIEDDKARVRLVGNAGVALVNGSTVQALFDVDDASVYEDLPVATDPDVPPTGLPAIPGGPLP